MNGLELKIPPLLLTFVLAAAMWPCADCFPQFGFENSWRVESTVLFGVLALAFSFAGVLAFRFAKTTVNPKKPDAASRMVTSGIYLISRNPMYVGFLFGLSAWAAYLSNLLALLLLPCFVLYMNRFQIAPEEVALQAKFGAEFEAYRVTVRRWL